MNLASYFANLIEINFKRPCWGLIVCVCDIAITIAMKNNCNYKKQLSLLKLEFVTFCEILQKKWRNTQWIYNIVYMLCTYMWLIFMVN